MRALTDLQNLFRDLFQLELADLDFGIYRLLRLKREEIEAFLSKQLPNHVEKAFQSYASEERAALESEIATLSERVRKEISEDALLPNGDINPQYQDIKAKAAQELLQRYQVAREKFKSVQASEAQMAEVFNHLYSFFARYYDSGDFIPRRRYGAIEAYAVPYRGEEVFFHWANKDQHYVKTAENFRDYAFTVETLSGPSRVRLVLTEASVPPGNLKGDTRYFFPLPEDATWDNDSRTFQLPFHYRLPREKEVERYGKNSKFQESLLHEALPKILKHVPDVNLHAVLSAPVDQKEGQDISLILKRLRHFCRRNTTDYFIHKDLESFLKRELEFYIKDQVLHLGDLDGDLESKRRTLRVVRELAEDVITFLAQIENVQKHLFEKRKFVVRTDYLVPIKEVARELWREVLSNKEQLKAWKDLFAIQPSAKTGKRKEEFLKEHPTLVVNTAYFQPEFKNRLLASFSDLDGVTDGLLIHAENYQALRLLERKYLGKIKCIYIDPPYNTGNDEFIYKDRYRHSSWLAMMENRLAVARNFISDEGSIFVNIDDNEVAHLKDLMSSIFGEGNFLASLIWQKIFSPKSTARHFSEDHDYILAFARDKDAWYPTLLPRTEEANARYENPDDDPRGPWTSGDLTARNYYSEGKYEVTSPTGKKFRPAMGTYWRIKYEKFLELDRDKRIWWGAKGDNMPRLKRFLAEVKQGMVPQTLWLYGEVGHTQEAKQELLSMVNFQRTEDVLNTVKPTRLIRRILKIGTDSTGIDIVADFFAGSGTTGDAVIRQNREDGGRRQFILGEMGDYFEDLILQRIVRSMYAPEWRDCLPKRHATSDEVSRTPRLVKVLRLESYDDALHNLVTEKTLNAEQGRAKAHKQFLGEDTYRLQYLVRLPLESSAAMLDVATLEHPFDYKIEVLTEDGPRIEPVDLVETFNLLYGLHVSRLETWRNGKDKRVYRAVKGKKNDGESTLILWRETRSIWTLSWKEISWKLN
jgi:adenine-specific DNA-methyltransferase